MLVETSDAPDRLHVLTEEALNDVTLKLKLKGWFTTNQTLVSTSNLKICHVFPSPFSLSPRSIGIFAGSSLVEVVYLMTQAPPNPLEMFTGACKSVQACPGRAFCATNLYFLNAGAGREGAAEAGGTG